MKLLHIMATVNDEYGGPVAALIGADAVGRTSGIRRVVATLDLPDDPWVKRCPVETIALGSRVTRRARRHLPWLRYGFTPHLVPWLRRHAGSYDRVVVHGLWNYATLAARRALPGGPTPYFVYPHGMLDPWFRGAYPLKHRAKQMTWRVCEGPLLQGARAVLFTTEAERRGAEGAFMPYRLRGVVTGYGTDDAPAATAAQQAAFMASVPGLRGRPYILFLGRVHPKKGCDLLLESFAAQTALPDNVHLVIAGPLGPQDGQGLRALAAHLGVADKIHWPGMLRDDAKWGALHGCMGFVLPSHGENFGVAAAEALACGKPVLLSDKVNIVGDVIEAAAGFRAPDSRAGTIALLTAFAALSEPERVAMGARGRCLFLAKFAAARAAERALAILLDPEPFL